MGILNKQRTLKLKNQGNLRLIDGVKRLSSRTGLVEGIKWLSSPEDNYFSICNSIQIDKEVLMLNFRFFSSFSLRLPCQFRMPYLQIKMISQKAVFTHSY